MTRRQTWLCAASALTLAACGVTSESSPRGLEHPALTAPAATADGALSRPTAVVVYLLRERQAVRVRRVVESPADASRRLDALGRGPTEREVAAGLRTAVAGGIRAEDVVVEGSTARVSLSAGFTDAGTQEQILALAQLVLTLTESGGVRAVTFEVDDVAVSVPRTDGSLTDDPVGRADYVDLLPSM